MPLVLVRSDGTNTEYVVPLRNRNGFSRDSGVGLTNVFGVVGHVPPGRLLGIPTNTMFHTWPVQLPHCALREIHCCCDPLPTSKSIRESEIQPPLVQPPLRCSTRLLLRMCMRRNGIACETAHCMPPPGGVTEKFSTPRQKFCVALLLGSTGSECTWLVMFT